jgi:hypothetical protein
MKRAALFGSCLAVALGTAGCQDQVTEPLAPGGSGAQHSLQSATPARDGLLQQLNLPSSAQLSDQYLAERARRAIDPGDYVCPASTPIVSWYVGEVREIIAEDAAAYSLLYNLAADLIPTYEALFLQTDATPQYFGYDGEYTKVMQKTDRDIRRFWDIYSDDIQLLGMHGSMLLDEERVTAAYVNVFGIAPATAAVYASMVRDAMLELESVDGGNHPFFSFNAFAFSTGGGSIPDKIVMGDGIMAGYEAMGFGDVAPQAIFAHEFAHHIQYENGYFDDEIANSGSAAEQTRYTELMADAMSAYFLTHKRGAAMNRKRVEQFLEAFYQIGDCGFTSPGHHGTPNQRMAAAQFGFDVADAAQKQGHILTAEQFYDLFVAAYPTLIAPDAP